MATSASRIGSVIPGGGEQCLELQMGEPRWRFGGDRGAADMFGGECSRMPSRAQVR